MSKIGRKPISLGDVQVQIQGHTLRIKARRLLDLMICLILFMPTVEDKFLKLDVPEKLRNRDTNRFWGLHRALLLMLFRGLILDLRSKLQINGLGFKAALAGNKVVFTIGYTHKIDLPLPKEVTLEIDKTGQLLTFKSSDRRMLGEICDKVRSFRPPEPYKGTGIKYMTEVIARKAGKTKGNNCLINDG